MTDSEADFEHRPIFDCEQRPIFDCENVTIPPSHITHNRNERDVLFVLFLYAEEFLSRSYFINVGSVGQADESHAFASDIIHTI